MCPNTWQQFCQRLFRQNEHAMKLGVEQIKIGLQKADNPQLNHRRVIVAGTNGKGFTGAAVSNILQAHGYRVGFFSSPHIASLEERFRVNGKPIDRNRVVAVGNSIMGRYMEHELTFYEICTVMAATLFADEKVDFGIYEVGLGGRLDAVRGLAPADCVVFTTIGFDHTEYLGTSLKEICFEKGVLMGDAPSHPTIVGAQEYPEAQEHFRRIATDVGARDVRFLEDDIIDEESIESKSPNNTLSLSDEKVNPHRRRHSKTATEAAKALLKEDFRDDKCQEGLKHLRWPGRFEFLPNFFGPNTEVLCDAAHNSDGLRVLVDKVLSLKKRLYFRPQRVVFSCMKDKDIPSMVSELRRLEVPLWACVLDNPRAASREQLSVADKVMTVAELKDAKPEGQTLICGSIYLLGDLMEADKSMNIWI